MSDSKNAVRLTMSELAEQKLRDYAAEFNAMHGTKPSITKLFDLIGEDKVKLVKMYDVEDADAKNLEDVIFRLAVKSYRNIAGVTYKVIDLICSRGGKIIKLKEKPDLRDSYSCAIYFLISFKEEALEKLDVLLDELINIKFVGVEDHPDNKEKLISILEQLNPNMLEVFDKDEDKIRTFTNRFPIIRDIRLTRRLQIHLTNQENDLNKITLIFASQGVLVSGMRRIELEGKSESYLQFYLFFNYQENSTWSKQFDRLKNAIKKIEELNYVKDCSLISVKGFENFENE